MVGSSWFGRGLAGASVALALAVVATPAAARKSSPAQERAKARVETALHQAVRAGGPFFTAPERAAVEQACGYPAGSWDGFEVTIRNGVIRCANGRSANTPEARAAAAAAAPRIASRIREALALPEIREAIDDLASVTRADETRERTQLLQMFREPRAMGLTRPPGR